MKIRLGPIISMEIFTGYSPEFRRPIGFLATFFGDPSDVTYYIHIYILYVTCYVNLYKFVNKETSTQNTRF